METFIALLRGINVGGKNVLPMGELCTSLENIGLMNIRTYIQSGNVVFESPAKLVNDLQTNIGNAINKSHGFTPQVLVLTREELKGAITGNPFPEAEDEPKFLHLFFLQSIPANPDIQKLESLRAGGEQFEFVGKVFYLYAREGFGRSKLAANVEKSLGVAVTARNWRSVNKVLSLAMNPLP